MKRFVLKKLVKCSNFVRMLRIEIFESTEFRIDETQFVFITLRGRVVTTLFSV